MQSFVQKKILKFGPKKPFLSIFKLKFEKANVSILEFAEMLKIVQRGKKGNLGPKMLYLGILGCKLEKLLIYFKSAPSNLSKWKVSYKNKNP